MGGVFATEVGQRMLSILELFSERGFRGLYEKCKSKPPLSTHNYYQTGLRRVNTWSDSVLLEDVEFVRKTYPDLDETYEACFSEYVHDRYRGKSKASTIPPSIQTFVRRYLESVAQQPTMLGGDFFEKNTDIVMKRMTCMDAARQALYASVTAESVKVELLSEVGTSASRNLSEVTREEVARASSDVISPNDSISQVGSRKENRTEVSAYSSVSKQRLVPRVEEEVGEIDNEPPPLPPMVRRQESHIQSHITVSAPAFSHQQRGSPPRRDEEVFADEEEVGSVVVTRHDFQVGKGEGEKSENVKVARDTRPVVSAPRVDIPTGINVSSRDSSISLGVRRARSPKR